MRISKKIPAYGMCTVMKTEHDIIKPICILLDANYICHMDMPYALIYISHFYWKLKHLYSGAGAAKENFGSTTLVRISG